MGKQNATMKSWVGFVKKTWADLKRSGKNVSYKDAMKEASKRKKQWKRGGSALAPSEISVGGGDGDADADDVVADDSESSTGASMGGRRRRRRRGTRRKSRRTRRRRH